MYRHKPLSLKYKYKIQQIQSFVTSATAMCRCRSSNGSVLQVCRMDQINGQVRHTKNIVKPRVMKHHQKRHRRFTQWMRMEILLLLIGIYGVVKFSGTIVDLLVDPVLGNCSRQKFRFSREKICDPIVDITTTTEPTQDWWTLSHTLCCSELIAAAPKIVKLESKWEIHKKKVIIKNSSWLTTTLLRIPHDNLRADRPNGKDYVGVSFGKKISPEPFYSLDDVCQHDGSALCLPKNPSHKVTVHPIASAHSKIETSNLAGVKSETDAATLKPSASEYDTPANKSGM